MTDIRDPPDGNIEIVGLGLNGALEGRNCLRGIIGDSGTFHLRCLGGPCKVLEPASRDPRQFWCLRHNSFIKSSEKMEIINNVRHVNYDILLKIQAHGKVVAHERPAR